MKIQNKYGAHSALKNLGSIEFIAKDNPKCPHCGEDYDIQKNEAWQLYDENEDHNIDCNLCGNEFNVVSNARWSFSTDEQEED